MSEHRSERVIEGEARPAWGRPPVAAVVVVGFLLAAIVGMTSAASPWVAGDGSGASPPRIVTEVLAVALAVGLCILLALTWIHTPRRAKAKKKSGAPPINTDEMGSGVRAGSLVLIGGILVVVALMIAFWFLLGRADNAEPPPLPRRRSGTPLPCLRWSWRRPHHRSSTGSSSGWWPRSRSSCPSRSLPAAGFGSPTTRCRRRRGARVGRSGGRGVDRPDRARPRRPSCDHPCLRADGARIRRRGDSPATL